MAFNFSSFNKERIFTFDNSHFPFDNQEELYKNLETLFKENGENEVYTIRGLYISTKSEFDPEAPVVMYDDGYANLPVHQLGEVKAMLADKRAIDAINKGEAGFIIEEFYQKRFKKSCYAARWGNVSDLVAEVEDK